MHNSQLHLIFRLCRSRIRSSYGRPIGPIKLTVFFRKKELANKLPFNNLFVTVFYKSRLTSLYLAVAFSALTFKSVPSNTQPQVGRQECFSEANLKINKTSLLQISFFCTLNQIPTRHKTLSQWAPLRSCKYQC